MPNRIENCSVKLQVPHNLCESVEIPWCMSALCEDLVGDSLQSRRKPLSPALVHRLGLKI